MRYISRHQVETARLEWNGETPSAGAGRREGDANVSTLLSHPIQMTTPFAVKRTNPLAVERSSSLIDLFTNISMVNGTLEAPSSSSEDQINNHQRKNQTEAAAAVISDSGAHVIAAATKQNQ